MSDLSTFNPDYVRAEMAYRLEQARPTGWEARVRWRHETPRPRRRRLRRAGGDG